MTRFRDERPSDKRQEPTSVRHGRRGLVDYDQISQVPGYTPSPPRLIVSHTVEQAG